MYVTILEYMLVRLGVGAMRLAVRVLELIALVVLWALGVLLRLVLRPLARELGRTLGRLRGQVRVALLTADDRGRRIDSGGQV